jgi:hypothetical protein
MNLLETSAQASPVSAHLPRPEGLTTTFLKTESTELTPRKRRVPKATSEGGQFPAIAAATTATSAADASRRNLSAGQFHDAFDTKMQVASFIYNENR